MMRDEKTGFDKMLRYIWKWDVNKMNDHLPTKTVPLSELLSQEEPIIMARDGAKLWIDREELIKVASLVPKSLHEKLHLPLVLIRRIDLGEGVFTISGGKLEAFFVAMILGSTNEPLTNYDRADVQNRIYRPQVQELRRKLRSLTVIGFGGASLAEDDLSSF
jgi:uncharacterized protein (UPF0216 family)